MYNWIVNHEIGLPGKRNLLTNSREISNIDNHILSSYHLSRYLEWTYELIFSTYKKNEDWWLKLSVPSQDDIKIRALYGVDNYLINVTYITKEEFWLNGKLIIHPHITFNKVYTDYLIGTEKLLNINLQKKNKIYQYHLPEKRKTIFILDVSNLK